MDLDALVRLRNNTFGSRLHFPVQRCEDVSRGAINGTEWTHEIGCEYLVANPVFVPALKPILAAAVSSDPWYSTQQSAFPSRPPRTLGAGNRIDPFLRLPREIIHEIVKALVSPDIAALRLSSRAFGELPIWLWRGLLEYELPWLYEAWSTDPTPYRWALESARDLRERRLAAKKFRDDFLFRRNVIETEMPEILEQWTADQPTFEWPECADKKKLLELAPIALPRERTNWYKLYSDITANWDKLKGLRNRKRIWNDIVQILDEMKKPREERIGYGPTPNTRLRFAME